jgi:hypothetical protein
MVKKIHPFYEIYAWYGMIVIVLAYAILSFGIVSSNSIIYQLLNITGAIGIILISFKKKAYQPGVLNVIWAIIALIALIGILF